MDCYIIKKLLMRFYVNSNITSRIFERIENIKKYLELKKSSGILEGLQFLKFKNLQKVSMNHKILKLARKFRRNSYEQKRISNPREVSSNFSRI